MARTTLSPDLVHDPKAVERDGVILDRICLIASVAASPYVSNALRRETQLQAAGLWVEDARTALKETTAGLADLNDSDIQSMVEEIARTMDNAVPQPDEDEIRNHAERLGRAMMSGWIEYLAQARESNPELFDAFPIPLHAFDRTGHWASFWQMLAPYATSAQDDYAILQLVCKQLLRDSAADSRISLPLGLKLDRNFLELALLPKQTLKYGELLEDVTEALRSFMDGVRVQPAPAAGVFLFHAQAGPQVVEVRVANAGKSTQDALVLCSETMNIAQRACMMNTVSHTPLDVTLMRQFFDRSQRLRDAKIDLRLVQG